MKTNRTWSGPPPKLITSPPITYREWNLRKWERKNNCTHQANHESDRETSASWNQNRAKTLTFQSSKENFSYGQRSIRLHYKYKFPIELTMAKWPDSRERGQKINALQPILISAPIYWRCKLLRWRPRRKSRRDWAASAKSVRRDIKSNIIRYDPRNLSTQMRQWFPQEAWWHRSTMVSTRCPKEELEAYIEVVLSVMKAESASGYQ